MDGDGLDPRGSITLETEKFVSLFSYKDAGNTYIEADIITLPEGSITISIDTIQGFNGEVAVAASPIGNDRFVVAWGGVEEADPVLRAQIFGSDGAPVGNAVSFTKPVGTLEGTPVIKALANGGFAIAFIIDVGGDDENIYTAAVAANGTIIADTTYVGTSTAGDQWNPSLIALSGNTYAVGWMSDSERGQQYVVEVIGVSGTSVPPPNPTPNPNPDQASSDQWLGSSGNDAHTGTSVSEVLKGLGGKDIIDGAGGNDKIWGGLGNDSLKGGDGLDIFVFDTKPNKSSNKDKIADFKVSDDTIWLDNKVFTKLGKAGTETKPAQMKKDFFTVGSKAKDKNDYVIYDNKKGVLSYDADGSGTKYKAVEIATLTKNLKMTHKDFFII